MIELTDGIIFIISVSVSSFDVYRSSMNLINGRLSCLTIKDIGQHEMKNYDIVETMHLTIV